MTAISQEASVTNIDGIKDYIAVEPKSVFTTYSSSHTSHNLNIINTFPWMAEFIKLCDEDVINENPKNLEKLMNFYYTNVVESVKECYSEPIKAKKLKGSMSEALIFFHMSYYESNPLLELSPFLAKMSDLMALYLDMEIEASRSGSESIQNIASKLTSCLFIYFGSSHAHIIDTILKTKMMNRDSWELSDLIFRRVLRDSPDSSIPVIMYMRYLLAFKLWKKIMSSAEEQKKIQLIAEQQLMQPHGFKEKLSCNSALKDIFPSIPESETDITRFLLEAKYCLRDKIEMFLKAVDDPKLQCILDHSNIVSCNYSSFSNKKEDSEHNGLMHECSNMNLETDIEETSLLRKINNILDSKRIHKFKHGYRSVYKNDLKKKKKSAEIILQNIEENDKSFQNVEIEEMIKKDNIYQLDRVWVGDTMDLAAEVELPSSPVDVTDIPTIKLKPQALQSKENMVYHLLDKPDTHSYQNFNDYDYNSELISEKKPELGTVINLLDEHKFSIHNEQEIETCSSIGEPSSIQELDLVHSEQVLIDSKSIGVQRTQDFLNEKDHFPLTLLNIPFDEHSSGVLREEDNEEISLEEHNEKNHSEELNVESINQRTLGELNGIRPSEGVTERTVDISYNERISEPCEETPPEKRGLVHDFTLKNDNKIYKFQVKLSSYWEKLNRCTWISILFPLFSEQGIKTPRCTCFLCAQNYNIIMKNWKSAVTNLSRLPRDVSNMNIFAGNLDTNILEEMKESLDTDGLKLLFWEPEMDEVYARIEELVKEENKLSNLPLKKRKASFTYNTFVKDEKSEISYPNTPMISIAEVEEKFRLNAMNMHYHSICNDRSLNYMSDFISHPGYSGVADFECDDVIVQSDIAHIPLEQNPVPEHQEQTRPWFKTPAQLKQFQHFSVTHELNNSRHTAHTYYNEDQETKKDDENDKIKMKHKITSSRKRKRTI